MKSLSHRLRTWQSLEEAVSSCWDWSIVVALEGGVAGGVGRGGLAAGEGMAVGKAGGWGGTLSLSIGCSAHTIAPGLQRGREQEWINNNNKQHILTLANNKQQQQVLA